MIKRLLTLLILLNTISGLKAQVVTTASDVNVCTGATTVDIPVKVSSFTEVGSISLKFSYVNSEITTPSVIYTDPGLDAWGTFQAHTATAGTIIISAFDPNYTPPVEGLTLVNNTTLFTLRFTIGTITAPSVLSFVENAQGNACEYGGVGPTFTPFADTPTATYYIDGSVTLVADPVAPALTKVPADAAVCAGQNLSVSITAGSGGAGTITDEYSYSTDNSGSWSAWSESVPSFAAIPGTNLIRSRRTATGTDCDESSYNTVSWTVAADPVAPGITKNPTDAAVCAGQTLTVSISAGSGGTGTIADEYRYSTNNGSSWSSWSASVPSFAAVTGTNLIQSRRTASGTGCDVSSSNEVSWTVAADPVAPGITKNPDVSTVCADETLTVSTSSGSGGTGTIADEYRYSTNNGSSWSSWSASVPSFAAVAGTNKIQSRRTADGTNCDESTPNEVSWTVNAKQSINGTFNYFNLSGNIPMTGQDITVNLYKSSDESHSNLIATDVTDASGYYEFAAICPDCEYDIVATSTHNAEDAVNTTDAAQANFWGPAPYSIEKVRFHTGDVSGPDLFIGATDAGLIQMHFVDGSDFDRADWTFWRAGFSILHNPLEAEPEYTEYYPTVNLTAGSDATANMYALATGDFNRSFNPNITKAASTTLGLVYDGKIQIGANQGFELPLQMINPCTVGAFSLILDFPADLVEVTAVHLNSTYGKLDWACKGNELRIGWYSPVPLNLETADDLVTISMITKNAFTIGNTIRIKLGSSPLNELADGMYDIIKDAIIRVSAIEATAVGIDENNGDQAINLNSYPNPFNNFTMITYNLPFAGEVSLQVFNLLGNKICVLVDEQQLSGDHAIKFDTRDLQGGLYMATLRLRSSENEIIRTIKLINNN